jgi:hypothetical protein
VLMLKVRLQREHGTSSISTDEQELLAYWEFLDQVKKLTEDFYHRTAVGGGKNGFFSTFSSRFREDKYQSSLKEAFERLWKTLPWMGERPAFNDALFAKEVSRRFGFEYWLGNQNRYFGLLAGHRVFDTTHLITQYGFHSRVRYVSLDMMISNGYSSWFWDGRAMIGGTANDSIVYQFRPAYSGAPYDMWEKVSDLARRAETEQKIQEGRLTDDLLAREKPYASLPSLALKLRYDGANRLLNSLKSKGIKESDLCLAFVSEWDRLVVESTVFGHEGRHLIDMQLLGAAYHDSLSPADQEFNAKLSEVIFSSDAKIAFANLIHSYGGDASPHGQAEEHIMKVVVKWIDEHKNEVAGFDPTKPTLPQFDLLTDDQIRRLFQLVDPLANRK